MAGFGWWMPEPSLSTGTLNLWGQSEAETGSEADTEADVEHPRLNPVAVLADQVEVHRWRHDEASPELLAVAHAEAPEEEVIVAGLDGFFRRRSEASP